VCAFKMRDVLDVFDGRFKAQQSANMHWLPVPPEKVRTFFNNIRPYAYKFYAKSYDLRMVHETN